MNNKLLCVFVTLVALATANVMATQKNATGKDKGSGKGKAPVSAVLALDAVEASHLTFMREEEKLARDVYLTLAEQYPQQKVFYHIATRSEQEHTNLMRNKLEMFNLTDPNPDSDDLPDIIGIYSGAEWGDYFTEKYQSLTEQGMISELDALYIGAFIEELDINDIAVCPHAMVDSGYPSPCGLAYTKQNSLQTAYKSLIQGSESHLRAFVRQIELVIGEGNYEAQYISQEEVDAILGR